MGIHYFNVTDLSSFDGRDDEFVDAFHPSEPACIRMLITMLRDPAVRALLPGVDAAALGRLLASATSLEAVRNQF